jgi:chemotaxis response regulator CheB
LAIGASAGGLKAIEELLSNISVSSGLAFVVIQHLDPTHKCMMPEILQRSTTMKVTQAGDGIKVAANCVHVIPPNKDLTIKNGILSLLKP